MLATSRRFRNSVCFMVHSVYEKQTDLFYSYCWEQTEISGQDPSEEYISCVMIDVLSNTLYRLSNEHYGQFPIP